METNMIRHAMPSGLLICIALLSACGGDETGPGAAPPAPAVTVVTVKAERVERVTELPGRTSAYRIAEVRPQVTGIVLKRNFEEGTEVSAGQTLYQIDPAPYQAALDSARAELERAEANHYAAELTAKRYAELMHTDAISKQANDEAIAALRQAKADISAARAALTSARIDLDFTRVKSPIQGRIGRSSVTQGALVTANQAEALAIVRQLDPIYVDLTQSSAELMQLRREIAEGRLQPAADDTLPVRLVFEDGTEYAAEGRLAFTEVSVDPSTGSVSLRAVFPNPEGQLLPGMYVRARLAQGVHEAAFRVPHAAVSRDPRGNATVMRIGEGDKVEAQVVKTAQSQGDKWVVTDGLKDGDRVIIEGLQRVRPGAQVQPQEQAAVPPATTAAN